MVKQIAPIDLEHQFKVGKKVSVVLPFLYHIFTLIWKVAKIDLRGHVFFIKLISPLSLDYQIL